jgi:hypothetical protein
MNNTIATANTQSIRQQINDRLTELTNRLHELDARLMSVRDGCSAPIDPAPPDPERRNGLAGTFDMAGELLEAVEGLASRVCDIEQQLG